MRHAPGNEDLLPGAGPQVEHDIGNALTGAMIGNVAATVRGMKLDSCAPQHFFTGQEIFHVSISAQSDDVGMLNENKLI